MLNRLVGHHLVAFSICRPPNFGLRLPFLPVSRLNVAGVVFQEATHLEVARYYVGLHVSVMWWLVSLLMEAIMNASAGGSRSGFGAESQVLDDREAVVPEAAAPHRLWSYPGGTWPEEGLPDDQYRGAAFTGAPIIIARALHCSLWP